MKVLITVCVLTLLLSSSKFKTNYEVSQDSIPVITDTVYKRNYLTPAIQSIGFDILLNRYNYHISGLEWANVNPSTWRQNIKTGFNTDGDAFGTNWFSHPSHGALSFNSARINNLGFYRSMPYVYGSSLIWEYFAETEPPSIIDIYTTTFGGIHLGEITYRLTDIAWNNPYSHYNRRMRNVVGSLINPMAAFNRWVMGKSIPKTDQTLAQLRMSFLSGFVNRVKSSDPDFADNGYTIGLGILYGDPEKEVIRPFDRFKLDLWVLQKNYKTMSNPFFNFTSDAALIGGTKDINSKLEVYYSINNSYSFLNNELFKFSSLALAGDINLVRATENYKFNLGSKMGLILMGSSGSKFVQPVHSEWFPRFKRDYLYGHGLLFNANSSLEMNKIGDLIFDYNRYDIYSKDNPKGWKSIGMLSVKYDVPLYSRIKLRVGYNNYFSQSNFITSTEKLNENDNFQEILLSLILKF